MIAVPNSFPARALALAGVAALLLAGCEGTGLSLSRKIDYKSTTTGPSLEIPPDLATPQYDERYAVSTASGLAARDGNRARAPSETAPNVYGDARIVKVGNERWLAVKTTPDVAWKVVRQFWTDIGFAIAIEQPATGVIETDWAENRAELPPDFIRQSLGKVGDFFYTTYKRDKFRTRIERGTEPGTVDIYISARLMEQVPTAKIDNSSPAAFAWAVLPPDPGKEAEMLSRLMVRFGTPEPQALQAVAAVSTQPDRAKIDKAPDGTSRLVIDDTFDRAWRRVGLALDRSGFTVVDRDRSTGIYFVRYGDPDSVKKEPSWWEKLLFWKNDDKDKPEQYRILVAQADPRSVVSVQDPNGAPDKTPNSDKILTLIKEQLK